MDTNNNTFFPSTGYQQVSSKRRKINMSNSSILNSSNNSVAERVSADFHRSSLRQATSVKFQELKVQIEEIIEEEERLLETQKEVLRNMIKQLGIAPAPSVFSPQEYSEAEKFTEAEMSQIKRRMLVKIINLLTGNLRINNSSREDISTLPKAQENGTEGQKQLSAAGEGFYSDKLAGSSIKIQKFHPGTVVCSHEPQSAKDVIPTPRCTAPENLVFGDRVVRIQKGLNDVEKIQPEIMFIPEQSGGSFPSLQCYGSRDYGTVASKKPSPPVITIFPMKGDGRVYAKGPHPSLNPTFHEDPLQEVLNGSGASSSQSKKNDKAELQPQDLWIPVSNYYVLVSHAKFFEIDWTIHFETCTSDQFICIICSAIKNTTLKMKDHIWAVHYNEGFLCPFCPHPTLQVSRHAVGAHIRRVHPNQLLTTYPTTSGF